MINGLRPYPAYRDSGLDWLGEVPEHWELRRLKGVAEILNGATPASGRGEYWGGDILWMTPEDLGRLRGRDIHRSRRSITRVGYESCGTTLAPVGSTVVSTRAPIGHLAILGREGCTNQGCKLLVPENDAVVPEWAYLGLLTARSELQALGQGTTFAELSRDALGAFALPLPPLSEQRAIARFLDDAERRIRRYIRAKERLIKLLEERKRALIHEAVTGRIDVRTGQPYPAYKDSGVEWLGKVPEHWEVVRLGALMQERGEQNNDGQIGEVLSVLRDRGVVPYAEKGNIGNKKSEDITRYKLVEPGDLVVNSMNVIIGSVGLSRYTGCLSPVYYVFKARFARDQPQYLGACFQSKVFQRSLVRLGNGILAHRMRIPMDLLKCEQLPRPSAGEQTAIARYASASTRKIDEAFQSTRRQIALLKEYRTRLIADVVTGKLDVREAAARLPETEPLADDRDRTDTIDTESHPHATEYEAAREAYA